MFLIQDKNYVLSRLVILFHETEGKGDVWINKVRLTLVVSITKKVNV